MALTRDYKETVVARIKRDPKFARALYGEALSALLEGETAEGLSMLRDLVHAEITFKELARQTGLGEKTLHRMLNRGGKARARGSVLWKCVRGKYFALSKRGSTFASTFDGWPGFSCPVCAAGGFSFFTPLAPPAISFAFTGWPWTRRQTTGKLAKPRLCSAP
jgi:DNA-binding phage protein